MTLEHSRGLRLGASASGRTESELERVLEASRVVVSLDPTLPGAALTARVLLTTLRRMPGQLVLERDGLHAGLVDELVGAVSAVDGERPLIVGRSAEATVRLHVGVGLGDQAMRLVPDGYGAHVAGQRSVVIRPLRAANALGSIYTAGLGAAEAFKLTARVFPARRVLNRHLRFCPVSLSSDLAAAPELEVGTLELTLVGVGAIGTGVVLLLAELGATGRLLAVDYQRYARENRGTYSLGGDAEVAAVPWKVDLAEAVLTAFDVIPFRHPIEKLPPAIDAGEVPWFPLVVSGLDTPEARRETQRLWPDRLIDAATGDTMLGVHDHQHGVGPCLICFFPPDRGGPTPAARLAEVTGLPVGLLARGDELLREEHLGDLEPEQRERLRPHLGKPVCGLARALGLTALDASDYRPSVPFISLQAAALAVGRLLARGLIEQANLVQYDGLFGPQSATLERMTPTPGCYCQSHTATIARVRELRRGRASH